MDKVLWLHTGSAAVVDVALSLGIGCACASRWVRRLPEAEAVQLERRIGVLRALAASALTVGAAGFLVALVAGLCGASSFAEWRAALPDVLQTPPGRDAEVLVVLAAAVWLWTLMQLGVAIRRAAWADAGLWCATIAVRSAAGHSAENGVLTPEVLLQLVHLLAIAAWSGGVMVAAMILPAVGSAEQARRLVADLSRLATVALLAVLASGGLKTWLALAQASRVLPLDPWTRLLGIKLALVGLVLVCALRSRKLLRMDGWEGSERARCLVNLRLEAIAMLAVLCLSAVIGSTAPPGA